MLPRPAAGRGIIRRARQALRRAPTYPGSRRNSPSQREAETAKEEKEERRKELRSKEQCEWIPVRSQVLTYSPRKISQASPDEGQRTNKRQVLHYFYVCWLRDVRSYVAGNLGTAAQCCPHISRFGTPSSASPPPHSRYQVDTLYQVSGRRQFRLEYRQICPRPVRRRAGRRAGKAGRFAVRPYSS